jgi:hypothetical protein
MYQQIPPASWSGGGQGQLVLRCLKGPCKPRKPNYGSGAIWLLSNQMAPELYGRLYRKIYQMYYSLAQVSFELASAFVGSYYFAQKYIISGFLPKERFYLCWDNKGSGPFP